MSAMIEGLVSVIIPAYNRENMLPEAVGSVLHQTYPHVEIIIVNDGSTDGTRRVADELAVRHPDRIRAIHQVNRGAGPAREAGRQLARGEFIQYLDSDDLLLPGKFAWQVAALRQRPDCGASYGFIRLIHEDGRILDRPYKGSADEMDYLFPRMLYDRWWNTDCALFRRSVCDAVGAWSDLRYSQDWEYDARVGALNVRLAGVKDYVCVQRQHAGVRQTGHGKWLHPKDQIRFFQSLYDCAVKAGVSSSSREMQHFARWLFFASREAALRREPDAAASLLALAISCAGSASRQMKWFSRLCRVTGWHSGAVIANLAHRVSGRRHGADTLRQSWMRN